MKTKDFYYDLPEELIAQTPLAKRDNSRLMVLDKTSGEIEHKNFSNIVEYFNKGDLLVLNDTKVMPARLFGRREGKEESIEFLLLKRLDGDKWETMVRPGRKVKPSNTIIFGDEELKAKVLKIQEDGTRLVEFQYDGIFQEKLDKLGEMPLPPYITEKLEDKDRYQTIYSTHEGSAAAPTAGLHFTEEIFKRLKEKGVNIVFLTLHVGLATFKPVRVEDIRDHHMHAEYYNVPEETANIINTTIKNGGKIIAVGTTTTRTLESLPMENGLVLPASGWTDIFITPGYKFKVVDQLITNFHLPESTLLMLVSALAGRENTLNAYNIAIKEKYRFFSFGDAMLIK